MYTDYCWYIIIHYSAKVDFNPHNNQISGHYCTSMHEMIFSIVGMKQFGEDEVNYTKVHYTNHFTCWSTLVVRYTENVAF